MTLIKNTNFTAITIDFEDALEKVVRLVFQDVHITGCLFHLRQAMNRKIKGKVDQKIQEQLVDELTHPCWQKEYSGTFGDNIKSKYKDNIQLIEYVNYYENEWLPRLRSEMINYTIINQKYRSNSILEGYQYQLETHIRSQPQFQNLIIKLINEFEFYYDEVSKSSRNYRKNN